MTDKKISELPAAAALAGTEELPVVQAAATVKSTPAAIKTYLNGTRTSGSGMDAIRIVYNATKSPENADLYIREMWRQQGVVDSIASGLRSTMTPAPVASPSEAEANNVFLYLASKTPEDKQVSKLVALLTGQLKESIKVVVEAEKWRYDDYERTTREAHATIDKYTKDYVSRCQRITSEAVATHVDKALGGITKADLVTGKTPGEVRGILTPDGRAFWNDVKATAKTLWDDYLSALRSVTNTSQSVSFLWEKVDLPPTPKEQNAVRVVHTGAAAIEEMIMWRTNRLESIKSAIIQKDPKGDDMHAQGTLKRVEQLLLSMAKHRTIELHRVAEMVIAGGFIDADPYTNRLDERFKAAPSLTRSVFATCVRAVLFAVLETTRKSFKVLETIGNLTSSSDDFIRTAVIVFLVTHVSEKPVPGHPAFTLYDKTKRGTDAAEEKLVTSAYLDAQCKNFGATLTANLRATYTDRKFGEELTALGAQDIANDLYNGDYVQLAQAIEGPALRFCMEYLYNYKTSMDLEFFSAAMEALGIVVYNHELSRPLEAAQGLLLSGPNWPQHSIGACQRFAVRVGGQWKAYNSSSLTHTASPGSPGDILLPSTSLPAVAADFFRVYLQADQAKALTGLAQRKLARGKRSQRVLMGHIQDLVNTTKDALRRREPVFSAFITKALQPLADATELRLNGLKTATTGVTDVAVAEAHLGAWNKEIEEVKKHTTKALETAKRVILDHINSSKAPAPAVVAPPAARKTKR